MHADLPKTLLEISGRSMIETLLDSVKRSGLCDVPTIIVGYKKEMIQERLGSAYDYVEQKEQLGTGHAVMSAKNRLEDKAENIMVLYGDQPLISTETILKLFKKHIFVFA